MRRDIPRERLSVLPSAGEGLSTQDVAGRRKRYGSNHIIEVVGNPWLELARDTLRDPMIWFLVGIGLVYAFLGSYPETVTLLVAILPLMAMDAFLHRRTRASTEGLGRQLAATATVLRDGTTKVIPAAQLVPGDLVDVKTGESFPADGLIVDGDGLQVDESSLTGEAYPVVKRAWDLAEVLPGSETPIWIDGGHWGCAGTRLLTRQAKVRVVYTGGQTLYGQIVRAATAGNRERTPLQTAIANLVTVLTMAAGVLCVILAGVRLRQGHDWVDALVSAATLAVAALPEEFPVVFTVFLGVGVYRLARRKALVRRGVSVENIGRITCICSDKTGTITEGRLRLEHLDPSTDVSTDDLVHWAGLASRRETGDPMDAAILDYLAIRAIRADGEILATYPYTEQRRRETVVVNIRGQIFAASKGSPEVLLAISDLSDTDGAAWAARVARLASEGHKVLACVYWELGAAWSGGEPDRSARFAGLLAFEDPIRTGVVEAVQECREAGIRVVMVTGDHPATAACVARAIGLGDGMMLGDELDGHLEHAGDFRADHRDVVARALPAQKLALVQRLQAAGEIVAVTGDGVNDVPALQAADIGIAMGERGTRSAREVASIVLLNDNFSTIVGAIAEGRQLFRNLQLSFQYLLLIHIPLVITATFIPLTGHPILYLPIHVVWLETLIHPTALLVFQELPARGPLQARSEQRSARFFSIREWMQMGVIGALITTLILWSYDRSLSPGGNIEHARAMAMVVLTFASASATAVLSRLRTKGAWIMCVATIVTSVSLVQIPWFADRLNLAPLHRDDWIIAMCGGLLSVAGPVLFFGALARLTQFSKAAFAFFRIRRDTTADRRSVAGTVSAPSLTRYAWLSILAALVTMAMKASAYLLTGSVALFSDAAESLVNLVSAGFALLILGVASRPADEEHPFGHGKAEYFSSGFEGALILVAASGIVWTAWNRLLHPQPLAGLDVGMVVSSAAALVNFAVARVLLSAGRRYRSITLEADGKHLMTDVWTTGAVLVGLAAVALTDWLWLDSVIAMLAAINIVGAGAQLILRSLSGLIGAAIPAAERAEIERTLDRYRQQGIQFHDLRARVAGTQRLITFHVLIPGAVTVKAGHDLVQAIENDIRKILPNLLIVTHLEPLDDPSSFEHEIVPDEKWFAERSK